MSDSTSQTQPQIQVVPVYTRYELELKLLRLNRRLEELIEKCWQLIRNFVDINNILLELGAEEESKKLVYAMTEAMSVCKRDEMVIKYLGLDTDVEKYGVKLNRRLLGVALMEEDDTIKPVAIWIDGEVWYNEE
jgi:hypothetical protein